MLVGQPFSADNSERFGSSMPKRLDFPVFSKLLYTSIYLFYEILFEKVYAYIANMLTHLLKPRF